MNKQFQSVCTCLSPLALGQLCTQTIQGLFHDNLPDDLKSPCPSMLEINIDLNGVLKLLSELNPGKAAWPNLIKPIVLKELRVEIAPVICLLFERSLQTGQLPVEWTKAQICPLFKKGDKSDLANYRPISLTCILCKVMEHIIASNNSKQKSNRLGAFRFQKNFW